MFTIKTQSVMNTCLECNAIVDDRVFNYSVNNFGIPLCYDHQHWIKTLPSQVTNEALELYFELKLRGVPAQLEKFDGNKTIDIAVPQAKVNIEIDGSHHNWQPRQALSDLRRTYHSFKKGYFTFRIPNSLVHNHLEETADLITEMLVHNHQRVQRAYRFRR